MSESPWITKCTACGFKATQNVSQSDWTSNLKISKAAIRLWGYVSYICKLCIKWQNLKMISGNRVNERIDPHGFWLARLMVESLFLMVDIQYPKPPAYPIISPLYPYYIPIVYIYIYIFPSLNVITIPTFNGYTVIQLNSHSKHMCFDAPPPTCCYSQCISCGQSTASRRIVGFPGSPGIRWWLVSVLWKLSCFQNHKTHLNIEEQCLCNCGPGVCVCHCVSLCVTVCHCVSLSFLYIGYCRYLQILELHDLQSVWMS